MLDMGDISDEKLPINLYETAIVGAVSQLARLNLAGIILTSSALPTSILAVPKWKPTYFIRREVEIFKRVCTDAEYDLHFGDYATGSVDIEPTTIRLGSPKARYTLPTKYEVYKGEKPGRSPNTMAEQYQRISEYLVKQPEYSGADFSWGDDFIYQASLPGNHPRGNATTWVTVNTSHHIEMVVSMLPSMKYDF
jgi:hypothetical protein